MTILIFSDSHSGMRFMRRCVEKIKPDTMIHLGDHYDDGEAMAQEKFSSVLQASLLNWHEAYELLIS
jgi:predicted phosphodiesterase